MGNFNRDHGRVAAGTEDNTEGLPPSRLSAPTFRTVVAKLYKDEITTCMESMAENDSDIGEGEEVDLSDGAPFWLKYFQAAVTHVYSKMEDSEKADIEQTLAEWQVQGLPNILKKK